MRFLPWLASVLAVVVGVGLVAGVRLVAGAAGVTGERPIVPDLELEALKEAARWPKADVTTVMTLTGRFMAARRDADGLAYFRERAASEPSRPLFLALEGLFQARTAGDVSVFRRVATVNDAIAKLDRAVVREPGLTRYLRGVVLAALPSRFGKAEAAVDDLTWVLDNKDRFPVGLRRGVYRALAQAYTTLGRKTQAREALARSGASRLDASEPVVIVDYSVTARDGFRFRSPRLIELAPGVNVAQGFDFGDIGFVSTDTGIVAIDAGTTEETARAALVALRRVTTRPITHVILTHAHWDHVGGLRALLEPDTRVIAQAKFAEELRIVNGTGVPFRYFFGAAGSGRRYDVHPDHVVREPETLNVGGTRFVLYPARGGETADALLIHVPDRGVLFVGDAFMPYLGAPFVAEGSAEGLFETITRIRSLQPRVLVHGHPPLTDVFTIDVLPAFDAALRELHDRVRAAIADGRTLVEVLHDNILPVSLREHPRAVIPYLVMRDNFVKRVYHQSTGYWKPDGEGMEVVAPAEWAAALDVLGGHREDAFVRSVRVLLDGGDDALALKLVQLGLARYPSSEALSTLRRRALDGLRARHQQLNPFKFIIYSEWAGTELPPVE
jgi:glyoxylase-like metal-dependent hydrolase (beta-lactamase superfamily II)